jgi:hypothetical protein
MKNVGNRNDETSSPSSWYNKAEANVCVRLCNEFKKIIPHKFIAVVTLYKGQRNIIANYRI